MKELYIIRHGETELNRLGIVQGRGINASLNTKGIAQGDAFFNKYGDVKFDKVYTSALVRTQETVKQFIDAGLPWQALDGLDELAWGEWEGKTNSTESRTAFRELVKEWQLGNYNAKFSGGESPNDVGTRLAKSIAHIKDQTEEKTVLICMHGRALRIILCLLLNKPFTEMENFAHSNTTLYRLRFDGEAFMLLESNSTAHLENLQQ